MPKYTEEELLYLIGNGDAQVNVSGSVTWAIGNTYGNKPGTFLQRPPGAAPIINSDIAADYAEERWKGYQNMEAIEKWQYGRTKMGAKGSSKPGYVYFIQCIEKPHLIKIGRSDDPFKRIDAINVGSPVEIVLLCFLLVPDVSDVERLFHQYFETKRVKGEWFQIRPIDVYGLLGQYWQEVEKEQVQD